MDDKSASEQIDDIITLYGGWKGETLSRIRSVVTSAGPEVTEAVKWRMATRPEGLPVWSQDGILCLAETFKDNIKLVFPKGARMDGYQEQFNARLNSSTDRAIEFHEGDTVDPAIIKNLVAEAQRLNALKKAGQL
jgi:hypothetical protein